jgi:GTP-binding protein EngB required for normal cell division
MKAQGTHILVNDNSDAHRSKAKFSTSDGLDVGSSLQRLAEIAHEFGSERVAEDASALAERVAEGRFYVACIGQFKRGKSTVLNALLGDPVLPTGVVPITTVPTVVRYGRTRSARVRFHGGNWLDVKPEELQQFVSEEHNPENAKGVEGVEVFVPSPFLATGMCFVDTPGLGSVFAGNTAATQAFIPHIDATLVVVGADPPIAGEELTLVEEVGHHVREVIVVMNKADRTSDAERKIAASFTRKVLEKRLGRPIGPIHEISGAEQLEHRGPERDWSNLVGALKGMIVDSGRDIVRRAGERGVHRLGEELLNIAFEERDALLRPIEESEQRIEAMRGTIAEAERSLHDLSYLFMGDQHRLSDLFLERRKAFLSEALPRAKTEFESELQDIPRRYGPRFRRQAMHLAQTVASRHVLPWLTTEQARAEEEYRAVATRFVNIGNDFLKKLAESGVPELARMPNALDPEKGFRVRSRFRFEGLINVAQPPSPLRYLADVFLGLVWAFSVIENKGRDFLEYLVEMNSTRVQSDVVDRVQESKGQLEVEIRKLLHEVSRVAERALENAREAKEQGAAAVEAKLARLRTREEEIQKLLEV